MSHYRRLLFIFSLALIILPLCLPSTHSQLVASANNKQLPSPDGEIDNSIGINSAAYPNFDIRSQRLIRTQAETSDRDQLMSRSALNANDDFGTQPGGQLEPLAAREIGQLQARVENLQVRWHAELSTPTRLFSYHRPLTAASQAEPVAIANKFLRDNRALLKLDKELAQLHVSRDFRTQHNGAHHVTLQQRYAGLEVFGGEARFTLMPDGSILALANDLVPTSLTRVNATKPALSAQQALALAAENVGITIDTAVVSRNRSNAPDRRTTFSAGDQFEFEPWARLMLFPLSGKQMRLAWQVRIADKQTGNRYAIFIDAKKGTVLLRHNLTWYFDDKMPTYRVYTGNAPQPNLPFVSTNPPFVERELIKTNGDAIASPNGWIDTNGTTRGNNVNAATDPSGKNENGFRPSPSDLVFDYPLMLATAGLEPENFPAASVTNLFYRCNIIHDYLYKLGFDEASGNFQADNFGRGGVSGDPVIADAQDGGGFNNANFATSEDGIPGRMQMFLWKTANPKVDASYDAEVIVHEYVHGLTTRLVGGPQNVIALFGIQSGGMGEGWSDWYAMSILSKPGDNPRAEYPFGSYVTRNFTRGIRRFPYTTNINVNRLTYADLDPTQTRFGTIDVTQVHRVGEVWCQALWEVRADFIDAYGFEKGKAMIERLVTDGLKITATNPTLVDGRDAILLADQLNNGGENQCLIWQGFARRGLGFGAASLNGSLSRVKQSFELPPQCNRRGLLNIDRKAYFSGETVKISLGDMDLAGSAKTTITVSSTAGDRETITLQENSQLPGQFLGQISFAITAATAENGILEGALGDELTFTYSDSSNNQGQPAQAVVAARAVRSQMLINDSIESSSMLVSDGKWKVTSQFSHSPTRSFTDSPGGKYADKSSTFLKSKKFNLTGLVGSRLVFWQKYDIEQDFDYGYVEVKVGKQAWQPIASYTGQQSDFRETVVDLSQFDGATKVSIRFRLVSDEGVTADGWYIDDVQVIGGKVNQ